MESLTGTRDGDLLRSRSSFTDGSSKLSLTLVFRIGIPTRLESGRYRWELTSRVAEGVVEAKSITFLGGQADGPTLGGVFLLLSAEGIPNYEITIPRTPLYKNPSR